MMKAEDDFDIYELAKGSGVTAIDEISKTFRLVFASDIEPRPICWLWPGRIPLGKLSLIIGDPGMGNYVKFLLM
jgi:hypothetical protein